MNILVCGYTGRLGRIVADALTRDHGVRPRALVRPKHLADGLQASDVDLVAGDLDDPSSLDEALADVNAVFVVSPVHPQLRERERGLAARAALLPRPPRIVKVSGLATRLDSYVDSGRWHAESERDMRDLGLTVTALQPPFFMQNLAFSLPRVRETGIVESGVGDAAIAMVDTRDIGEVAASVLVGGAPFEGTSVPITGPAALTYPEVADILADALGRTVRYAPQSLESVAASLAKSPMPDWHQAIMLQFNRAFREGLGADVADTVEQVLHRTPRSLREWARDTLDGRLSPGETNPFPSR